MLLICHIFLKESGRYSAKRDGHSNWSGNSTYNKLLKQTIMINDYSLLGLSSKWTVHGSKWTGVKLDSKWTVSKSKVDGLKGKTGRLDTLNVDGQKDWKWTYQRALMWTVSNKKVDGPKSRKRATLLVWVQLHLTSAFACTLWYFWIIHFLLFDRTFSL